MINWESDEVYRQRAEELTRYGDPDWLKALRALWHSLLRNRRKT